MRPVVVYLVLLSALAGIAVLLVVQGNSMQPEQPTIVKWSPRPEPAPVSVSPYWCKNEDDCDRAR